MGMVPSSNLVFGVDITDVEWPDDIEEKLEKGENITEAVLSFLEEKDGFNPPDDFHWPGSHLEDSRNLTVEKCDRASGDYRTILAVSSTNFAVSGWGNCKRLMIEHPEEDDIENLKWALSVLDISPNIKEPSWFLFSSFG